GGPAVSDVDVKGRPREGEGASHGTDAAPLSGAARADADAVSVAAEGPVVGQRRIGEREVNAGGIDGATLTIAARPEGAEGDVAATRPRAARPEGAEGAVAAAGRVLVQRGIGEREGAAGGIDGAALAIAACAAAHAGSADGLVVGQFHTVQAQAGAAVEDAAA